MHISRYHGSTETLSSTYYVDPDSSLVLNMILYYNNILYRNITNLSCRTAEAWSNQGASDHAARQGPCGVRINYLWLNTHDQTHPVPWERLAKAPGPAAMKPWKLSKVLQLHLETGKMVKRQDVPIDLFLCRVLYKGLVFPPSSSFYSIIINSLSSYPRSLPTAFFCERA